MKSQAAQSRTMSPVAERHSSDKDYDAFNRMLDVIRKAFLSLHAGVANEETWRWDVPVITFTWGDGVGVHRNLNGLLIGAQSPSGIEIESNAWADVREGKALVRKWQHFSAGRLDVAAITDENIAELVTKAYSEANSLEMDDLQQREVLARSE